MWKQYLYIEHNIQKVESFVSYIFQDIMFHAYEHKGDKLADVINEDTKKLLEEVKDCKIETQLKTLYDLFKKLDEEQVKALQIAFVNNNQIDKICNKELEPFRFKDLKKKFKGNQVWKDILEELKKFCTDMYTEHIKLKPFEARYGTMKAYYDSLVKNDSMCHCCGIDTILTEDNTPRDAFDHYLAKSIYPFISLNFHNLIPTCPHCNSSYKKEKDTLYEEKGKTEKRVKAFQPFRTGPEENQITVKIKFSKSYDKDKVKDCGLVITFSCVGKEEELKNWQRMYGIQEQYKKYCYSQAILDIANQLVLKGISNPEYLKLRIKEMETLNSVNGYFLQAAFTKAVCESLGIKI